MTVSAISAGDDDRHKTASTAWPRTLRKRRTMRIAGGCAWRRDAEGTESPVSGESPAATAAGGTGGRGGVTICGRSSAQADTGATTDELRVGRTPGGQRKGGAGRLRTEGGRAAILSSTNA